jgi:hypothetical protein
VPRNLIKVTYRCPNGAQLRGGAVVQSSEWARLTR